MTPSDDSSPSEILPPADQELYNPTLLQESVRFRLLATY